MFAKALARTAQIYGNRPATISTAGVQTWRDFVDRIQSVAAGLRGLALQPGDRVAILAGNTAEHLTMMYAVAWAGCVLVPLNVRLSAEEMAQIVDESGSSAIAGDGANLRALTSLATSVLLKWQEKLLK